MDNQSTELMLQGLCSKMSVLTIRNATPHNVEDVVGMHTYDCGRQHLRKFEVLHVGVPHLLMHPSPEVSCDLSHNDSVPSENSPQTLRYTTQYNPAMNASSRSVQNNKQPPSRSPMSQSVINDRESPCGENEYKSSQGRGL